MWKQRRPEPEPEVVAAIPREVINERIGYVIEGSYTHGFLRDRIQSIADEYGFTFDQVLPWVMQAQADLYKDIDLDNW